MQMGIRRNWGNTIIKRLLSRILLQNDEGGWEELDASGEHFIYSYLLSSEVSLFVLVCIKH